GTLANPTTNQIGNATVGATTNAIDGATNINVTVGTSATHINDGVNTGAVGIGNKTGDVTIHGAHIDIQDATPGYVHINTAPTGTGNVVVGLAGAGGSGFTDLESGNGNFVSINTAVGTAN